MQPDTAPTLKPCPMCGSGPAQGPGRYTSASFSGVEVFTDDLGSFVWCGTCATQARRADTEAEAIAAWNTRAAQPTACTECERLAEALEDIADHETDCPSMTATEAMEHTLSEIRDKARFALASHTVRLIDGGEHG